MTGGDRVRKLRAKASAEGVTPQEAQAFSDKADQLASKFLPEAHRIYRRWLGADYDTGVLDAVLCTAAAEHLTGDPPWLLVVGGSGSGKTETIIPLEAAGATMVSTLSGEAALLSGTPAKERAPGATGGLLRQVGNTGLVVIKDFTSILSMHRDTRDKVLAALREIHDGAWHKPIGGEGGVTLIWSGRLVIIGACTTAWDAAHTVIATMGDRFLLVRPRTGNRRAAGLQALDNVGDESEMKEQLGACVADLLGGVRGRGPALTRAENLSVLDLADLIARTRTPVHRSYNGDPQFAHAAEMPTRLAKQLAQIARGGLALGMDRARSMAVVERVAADTMPPRRLRVLVDIGAHPGSSAPAVTARLQLPDRTVIRELQSLQLLGLLAVDEIPYGIRHRWVYTLADDVSRDALARLANGGGDISGRHPEANGGTDISGRHPAGLPEMSPPPPPGEDEAGLPEMSPPPRKHGQRLTPAERGAMTAIARTMFSAGSTQTEVKAKLGISWATVNRWHKAWQAEHE